MSDSPETSIDFARERGKVWQNIQARFSLGTKNKNSIKLVILLRFFLKNTHCWSAIAHPQYLGCSGFRGKSRAIVV
ncbi:hypothetical protein ACN4EK_00365 [Pantanalinema rosaneae CENA516]|uniref:hypothetical protein n=1 Tax=Pantanalinema rosaneae TaxID=1620701 RepID=UPI003D6E403E